MICLWRDGPCCCSFGTYHRTEAANTKGHHMTDCNSQPITFSSFSRRNVVADFEGGAITSDAGALLLREVDRKLGLIDRLDRVIPDPRNQNRIIHQQSTMLRQRIFAIAMGYEDGNDHQHLRDDPLMQLASERGID